MSEIGAVADYFSEIEDLEGRSEITTDAEGKIISYRDADGVKHEEVGIETPLLRAEKIESSSVHTISITNADDTIYVERPKLGEIWFDGILPTDMSDERTPTWLTMTFKNSGVPQFRCNCTLAIQGHGSAQYAKKGYTLEPYNANKEAISIKFGDMIAIDSFHLKAYATDSLHCRDMANFNIWRDMIKKLDYPYSKFNNIPFAIQSSYNKNKVNIADAKYAPDGFPVVCYLNGEFLGLYTIKLKKSRQNYGMEKSVKSQVFMDAINYSGFMTNGFDPYGWDVKNPKMKNYEEGQPVPDATVLSTINRFFDWLKQIDTSDPTTYSNYADYMVLPYWIDFIVFSELVFSEDIVGNNINLATWDAEHWSIIPYDTDLSVGLHPWEGLPPYQSYVILEETPERFVTDTDIFIKLKQIFDTQIKTEWSKLRNSKFITPQNLVSYYIEQCNSIPRDVYEADYEKWGTIWTNGVPSTEQLYKFMESRIAWLDSQWLTY